MDNWLFWATSTDSLQPVIWQVVKWKCKGCIAFVPQSWLALLSLITECVIIAFRFNKALYFFSVGSYKTCLHVLLHLAITAKYTFSISASNVSLSNRDLEFLGYYEYQVTVLNPGRHTNLQLPIIFDQVEVVILIWPKSLPSVIVVLTPVSHILKDCRWRQKMSVTMQWNISL